MTTGELLKSFDGVVDKLYQNRSAQNVIIGRIRTTKWGIDYHNKEEKVLTPENHYGFKSMEDDISWLQELAEEEAALLSEIRTTGNITPTATEEKIDDRII